MRVSIKGTEFTASDRYAVGHTVNEAEAAALNGLVMENVANNLRSTVTDWTGTPEELQSKFAEYLDEYEIGIRGTRGPGAPTDPIGAEAHRLALVTIKNLLKTQGAKVSEFKAADLNEAARQLVEQEPKYRTDAEANIEAMRSRTTDAGSTPGLMELLAKAKAEREAEDAAADVAADQSAGEIVGEAQQNGEPEPAPVVTEQPRRTRAR